MNVWSPILWLSLIVLAIGGLNWGLVGLFEFDLVAEIFGETFGSTNTITRVVYVLVGAAALVSVVALAGAQMSNSGSMQRTSSHRA
jgi:uncharacterized membrane protein YuzA (DUF378 family)